MTGSIPASTSLVQIYVILANSSGTNERLEKLLAGPPTGESILLLRKTISQ